MRKWLFYMFDLSIVAASPFVAVAIRQNFEPAPQQLLGVAPYAALCVTVASLVFLVAETHKGIWRYVSLPDFTRIVGATTAIVLIAWFIAFSVTRGEGIARSVPFIQWGLISSWMIFARLAARAAFRQITMKAADPAPASRESVLVVGLNEVAELYLRCVARLAAARLTVVGLLDEAVHTKGRRIHNCRVLGAPAQLSAILANLNVHGISVSRVVITSPFEDLSPESRDELLRLESSGAIRLDFFSQRLNFDETDAAGAADQQPPAGGSPFLAQVAGCLGAGLDGGHYAALKRTLDIAVALALLVVSLPVMALVAVLVAVDLGFPLTFWQERPGRHGRPFRVYKFRTMLPAHDEHGHRIPDPDRHTLIGMLLRRTRLDELPQLFNILTGEMSFVGPRPLLPVDQLSLDNPRLLVRPGLTGWAQVNGGTDVSIEDKMVLDVWYIKHMSLRLDLTILARTFNMVVHGQKLDPEAIRQAYADLGLPQRCEDDEGGRSALRPGAGGDLLRRHLPA